MLPDQPNPPAARIPARSRQQAMDWSLVLASQGIEHVLDHSEELGWSLITEEAHHSAALSAIRQYRVENRRWPWQNTIPKTSEVFDWFALAWVLLTVVFYWLSDQRASIEGAGIVNGVEVAGGEWWRLFTATMLHANIAHLAANAGFGILLLGLAMGRYGTGLGLLGAFLAGAAGNVVSWMAHGNEFRGLGASGVVMGALGLITVQSSFDQSRRHPQTVRVILAGVVAGLMLFVLLGVSPDTDVVAHFGGFTAGIAIGFLLRILPHNPVTNVMAALLFVLLLLSTWWLALRHAA